MIELLNDFIKELKEEGNYTSKEGLEEIVKDLITIIKKNPDSTPEELIDILIDDSLSTLSYLRNKYNFPGFITGISVKNIDVKLLGGNINYNGEMIPDNALFDIASMSKFYTQIIAYNLINENAFSFDDKIGELDKRFRNLGDLKIRDILSFTASFQTNGKIANKKTIEEALNCLYSVNVIDIGEYNYNDIGMEIIKEVMEKVTNKSYNDLLKEYIIEKLSLKDTFLVVPNSDLGRVTATPNADDGKINDSSARALGDYSGHAGVIASNDDLIKLGKSIFSTEIIPKNLVKDVYTPGLYYRRGTMGNVIINEPLKTNTCYIDFLEPINTIAIQGSTRVQMNMSKNHVSTILLNPCSMGMEIAKIKEKMLGFSPNTIVKVLEYERNGKKVIHNLIDPRKMIPIDEGTDIIARQNALLALKLRFLNKYISKNDNNFKGIKYVKRKELSIR